MAQAVSPAREAVLARQRLLLRRLLRSVWERSAFYRDYWSGHGIRERELEELSAHDLPTVTKKLLMEHFDQAVTDGRLRKSVIERWLNDVRDPSRLFLGEFVVLHGSGSSGTTGIFVYSRTDWSVMNGVMAGRLPPPENAPEKTRVAFYRLAHSHLASAVSAGRMAEQLFEVQAVSVLDPPDRVIEQLERFQPHRLTGNSSSIAVLADWALEGRLRISPRRVFAIGDLLTPGAVSRIRQAWQAPVVDHYGASESLFLGLRSGHDEPMALMDELNVFDIVGDGGRLAATGEAGRAVITNLYNYTLPIVGYELGDYVERGEALPSGLSSIRAIRPGKAHDVLPITLDDGRPAELPTVAMTSFYAFGLERAQFVSLGRGRVRVDYVSEQDIDHEVASEFGRILAMVGASRTGVTVRRVPHIAPDPHTNKVRLVRVESPATSAPPAIRNADPAPTAASDGRSARPAAFSRAEIESSLVARFARQVRLHADRPAVRSGKRVLTYDEVNRASNRVAHALLASGGAAAEPVVLLFEPGIEALIAIMGVLKAGKFYVPLDLAFPPARLAALVAGARPERVLCDTARLPLAKTLMDGRGECLDIEALDPSTPDTDPGITVPADAYVYVLYTSGSTGRPKGVTQSHRAALHQLAEHTAALSVDPRDRITWLHSHCFSDSRLEIFGALMNGATVCHFDVATEGVARLRDWLREEEITLLHWLPTGFRHLAGSMSESHRLPRLRAVMLSSEPLRAGDVELHRRFFGRGCPLWNRFGTTETGTIAQQIVDENTPCVGGTAPIGLPIGATDVLLLDDNGREVATGELGELVVRSDNLSPGYWRDPETTRAVFAPDPVTGTMTYRTGDLGLRLADGTLVHAGRKDFQIKVRGHRVEIGEVETALVAHPGVREAAVTRDDAGESLVAYMTPRAGASASGRGLRAHLAARLPAYMIPSTFVWLDRLPLNANGKLDRLALPRLSGRNADLDTEFAPPRTPVEDALAHIWRSVLGVSRVGVHDDLFDLGGHSISAAQIVNRVGRVFGVEIEFRDLFESPTVGGLAEVVARERRARDARKVDGVMSEEEHRRLLAEVGDA